jgi:hypothetical protein
MKPLTEARLRQQLRTQQGCQVRAGYMNERNDADYKPSDDYDASEMVCTLHACAGRRREPASTQGARWLGRAAAPPFVFRDARADEQAGSRGATRNDVSRRRPEGRIRALIGLLPGRASDRRRPVAMDSAAAWSGVGSGAQRLPRPRRAAAPRRFGSVILTSSVPARGGRASTSCRSRD